MPIFDQGYQHWKGALSGRFWRCLAITRQGLRGQLKIVRIVLILAWLPALLLVAFLAVWGLFEQGSQSVIAIVKPIVPPGITADPYAYRQAVWTIAYSIFFKSETFFIMLLVVIVGPNLISRDLRFNALPLYFSRPLTRLDYFLGKLGVIAALVAAVALLPAVAAYIFGICFSLDLGVIRDTWRILPASILYGLIIVISAGTLMLALSSLSRRSLYVGIAWIGLWIISSAVAGILGGIQREVVYHETWRAERNRENLVSSTPEQPPDPDQPLPKDSKQQPIKSLRRRTQEGVDRAIAQAAPTNWRPLFSYTANLQHLGDGLLNVDDAWVQVGRALEAPRSILQPFFNKIPTAAETKINERRLADQLVMQHPWTWSAGVLAGLLGLSLWIMITRVKSLDRLK